MKILVFKNKIANIVRLNLKINTICLYETY